MKLTKLICAFALLGVAACGRPGSIADPDVTRAELTPATQIGRFLEDLPPPNRPLDVAVYSYEDQTGQQRVGEGGASSFSKAVGQGGVAVLVDVLTETADSGWFNVIERSGVQNLLNERSLIEQSHAQYQGAQTPTLPPLRFAGIILEGGIINYESNTLTGGIGASILGVGYSTQYRRDYVTVALRAVSVNTGEVLTSITTDKAIYSLLARGDVFRFASADSVLDIESGFTRNEPIGLAVRQAMELAVLGLIVEGTEAGLWDFQSPASRQAIMDVYEKYEQGRLDPQISYRL